MLLGISPYCRYTLSHGRARALSAHFPLDFYGRRVKRSAITWWSVAGRIWRRLYHDRELIRCLILSRVAHLCSLESGRRSVVVRLAQEAKLCVPKAEPAQEKPADVFSL
jgi:hypothetical protein